MTSYEIEAFLAICQYKNISKAADALFINQSSLSARLKTLEKELGCMLFTRQKGVRELTLTAEGQRFYSLAFKYMEIVRQMHCIAKANGSETLRVSSSNSVGTFLLPPAYKLFLQQYPEICLEIQDTDTETACRNILQGETDLVFTAERNVSAQVDSLSILSEPMVFICETTSSYPDTVAPTVLAPKDAVYIAWSTEYESWHQSIFGDDMVPQIRLEIMSQLSLFLAKKNRWSIVPSSVAAGLANTCNLRRCQTTFSLPCRTIYALCARGSLETSAIQHFLRCVRDSLITFQEIDLMPVFRFPTLSNDGFFL